MDKKDYFRRIPGTDVLLDELSGQCRRYGKGTVLKAIRQKCGTARAVIESGGSKEAEEYLGRLREEIIRECARLTENPLRRVINATGILLHTNLGRAPLGERQCRALQQSLRGYSALELELDTGKRGNRSLHCRELISLVTGAQDGIAVNNNAGALLLALSALAAGKEVLVSRGELVEVGGHFRIPDVMAQSGALLREVGTTNRTGISDYQAAVGENTGAILKVHTSNYKILGFTKETELPELAELGKRYGIPVIMDLGGGALIGLEKFGLLHEPTVQETLKKGADVVCFSGDKLMGGPQAGILAGKTRYIAQMEQHPLMRALRLDKGTIAVLAATFAAYLDEGQAQSELPLLGMLSRGTKELEKQGTEVCRAVKESGFDGECGVVPSAARMGGGSLPLEEIPSVAVFLKPGHGSSEELKRCLRFLPVPVITYEKEGKVWMDMRTVTEEESRELTEELCGDFFSGGCL